MVVIGEERLSLVRVKLKYRISLNKGLFLKINFDLFFHFPFYFFPIIQPITSSRDVLETLDSAKFIP